MGMAHVLERDLWCVMRTFNIRRFWLRHHMHSSFNCKLGPLSDLQVLPSGQYGLCPLRSHKGQVTFLEPYLGDYTQKLAKPIWALKLSVTTYFHWVTTTTGIHIYIYTYLFHFLFKDVWYSKAQKMLKFTFYAMVHCPAMFHKATVKPTRPGPSILYNTPLK